MKIFKHAVFITFLFMAFSNYAQKAEKISIEYIDGDESLGIKTEKTFKKIIKKVYPQLMKEYNPDAVTNLKVIIDNSDKKSSFVAYADGNTVTVSSEWMHKHPEDFDLMTHEIMHLIQAYPHNAGPGWITEGIADYVRDKYGLNNKKAGWKLTGFQPSHHYTNSYRITARFLKWTEKKYNKELVKKLDFLMRNKQYSDDQWKKLTGKELQELWEAYSKNPEIS
ncbi:basic secretory family protein [Abyssalbus ytuae]|uniref:Basic secretory family protein n=1 Tax=Abyssalbus ytuae TaxID=2926907 RepID=A0A9E6ZZH1_9FLAO|nr:basic secretory family protein [Abyssalbus ytuae]UOB16716.1 basic secretory family protein [Abyssalbus ytuae]